MSVKWSDISYLKNNNERNILDNNKDKEFIYKNNCIYANDNKSIKYIDIINYINKTQNNEENRYLKYIYEIVPKKKRKINKKQFRRYCSKFNIDMITNRLQSKIEFTDKNGNKIKKYFYIAYINEKKFT